MAAAIIMGCTTAAFNTGEDLSPQDLSTSSDLSEADLAETDFAESNSANDLSDSDLTGDVDFAVGPTMSPLPSPKTLAFDVAQSFATGNGPVAIVQADFNGDGKLDVATANSDNTMSVLLGKGDGTFKTAASYQTGTSPAHIAAGNFNADDKPDIAVGDGNGVSVFINNGNGTFKPLVAYALDVGGTNQPGAGTLQVIDLDNDDKSDILLESNGQNVFFFLKGNGDGTFTVNRSANASYGLSFAIGQYSNDTNLDVLFQTGATIPDTGSHTDDVSYLLGDGSGGFSTTGVSRSPVTTPPQTISVFMPRGADFDGDHVQDLAVAVHNTSTLETGILLMPGVGDGTLGSPAPIALTGDVITDLQAVDLDADGKMDLVAAITMGQFGTVAVVRGNGDGTFEAPRYFGAESGTAPSLAFGDFDADGNLDVAVTNKLGNSVTLMRGAGGGELHALRRTAGGSMSVLAADFNHDGLMDLVANSYLDGKIHVSLGQTGRHFGTTAHYAAGDKSIGLAVARLNADVYPDVVSIDSTNSQVDVLLANSDGTLNAATAYFAGNSPYSVVAADFDGDTKIDLIISGPTVAQVRSLSLLSGAGDGSFGGAMSVGSIHSGTVLVAADVNHDGKMDLLSENSLLLGNGNGTFQAEQTTGANAIHQLVVTHWNSDANPDLVSGGAPLVIATGDGGGMFNATPLSISGGAGVAVSDFNDDTLPDIAFAHTPVGLSMQVSIIPQLQGGNLGSPQLNFGSGYYLFMISSDFDNDGLVDIAAVSSGSVDVFFNISQ